MMKILSRWNTAGTMALLICLTRWRSVAADTEGPCGPKLVLWENLGVAEPHGSWTARYLTIERDRSTFIELTIRFGPRGFPAEEARWFDAPTALQPTDVFVTTTPCDGDCLRTVCDELAANGLGALRAKASKRCSEVKLQNVSTGGTPTEVTREVTTLVVRSGKQGILLDPAITTDREPYSEAEGVVGRSPSRTSYRQEEVDVDSTAPEPSPTMPHGSPEDSPALPRSAGACLASGAGILGRLSSRESPIVTGLAAIPTARGLLEELRSLDPKAVPATLPDEFLMTAAVGPPDFVKALAIEKARFGGGRPDQFSNALKILGDRPVPAAADLLVAKLRFFVAAKNAGLDASLAIRALLAADPGEARRQGVTLLLEPGLARPFLGVFAVTEPKLREVLEHVNLQDPAAVHRACEDVIQYLASHGDEELRLLATKQLKQ